MNRPPHKPPQISEAERRIIDAFYGRSRDLSVDERADALKLVAELITRLGASKTAQLLGC